MNPGAREPPEARLARLWEERCRPGAELLTAEGLPLRVVYRGERNHQAGPDYCGAIVAYAGGELAWGDVELHRGGRQWWEHGHHRDERYNGVILHVVAQAQGERRLPLADGRWAPILVLAGEPGAGAGQPEPGRPQADPGDCGLPREEPGDWAVASERAGWERLEGKAAAYRAELAQEQAAQVLYRGILEALGYSRNREPCREVAERLPLPSLWQWLQGVACGDRELAAQALLLGTAGLLPCQRPQLPLAGGEEEEYAEALAGLWRGLGQPPGLHPSRWEVCGRPANHPVRRLVGAAALVIRWESQDPVGALVAALHQEPGPPRSRALEELTLVPAAGYWVDHWDFGREGRSLGRLVGAGRAREIAVNVFLPFALALGQSRGDAQLQDRARAAYASFPALPENRITRAQRRHLGAGWERGGLALRQQGLHHLYWRHRGRHPLWACPWA